MKFGLFSLMPHRDPGKPEREVFTETLELVKMAEGSGFDIAWFAEHHFSNYSLCPSPLMMAAWAAGQTTRIRLGTGVIVMPLYHVARLVEEIAMVDLVSNGRLVAGLGSGYQDYEFQRFGAVLEDSKQVFLEMLDVLELAFTRGEYEYSGRYVRIPRSTTAIRPIQKPFPEVYVAGLYTDEEVQRRVVRSGYVPFATAGWNPAGRVVGFKQKYAETARAMGKDPAALPFAVQRYVHVTDSRAEALEAAEHIRYTGRVAMSMRFKYFQLDGAHLRELPAKDEPTPEQIVENAIIGDVETCIAKAIREIETLSPTHFSCFMQFGGLPFRRAARSLDLFVSKVVPALERHFGGLERVGTPVPKQQPMGIAGR